MDSVYWKDTEFIHLNFELEENEESYKDPWSKMLEQMFIIVSTALTLVSCVGLAWIKNTK